MKKFSCFPYVFKLCIFRYLKHFDPLFYSSQEVFKFDNFNASWLCFALLCNVINEQKAVNYHGQNLSTLALK